MKTLSHRHLLLCWWSLPYLAYLRLLSAGRRDFDWVSGVGTKSTPESARIKENFDFGGNGVCLEANNTIGDISGAGRAFLKMVKWQNYTQHRTKGHLRTFAVHQRNQICGRWETKREKATRHWELSCNWLQMGCTICFLVLIGFCTVERSYSHLAMKTAFDIVRWFWRTRQTYNQTESL